MPIQEYKLPFGKYAGKSLEQVALKIDYPYFIWLKYILKSPDLAKRAEEIFHALNSYIPVVHCEVCKGVAANFSVSYEYDSRGKKDYNIPCAHFYCGKSACLDTIMDETNLFPIKFDAILMFPSKSLRRAAQELMLRTAGFSGRVTIENGDKAYSFIESLRVMEERGKEPLQLSLF